MNANELADKLENAKSISEVARLVKENVIPTLRQFDLAESIVKQQQVDIKNMQERMIVAEQELNHMRSFFGCDPAYYGLTPAEPVAWMASSGWAAQEITYFEKDREKLPYLLYEDAVPLYIHPTKTITDEAIITVADPLNLWDVPKDKLLDFARAILRKTQEK